MTDDLVAVNPRFVEPDAPNMQNRSYGQNSQNGQNNQIPQQAQQFNGPPNYQAQQFYNNGVNNGVNNYANNNYANGHHTGGNNTAQFQPQGAQDGTIKSWSAVFYENSFMIIVGIAIVALICLFLYFMYKKEDDLPKPKAGGNDAAGQNTPGDPNAQNANQQPQQQPQQQTQQGQNNVQNTNTQNTNQQNQQNQQPATATTDKNQMLALLERAEANSTAPKQSAAPTNTRSETEILQLLEDTPAADTTA
jgi:hypothetical protein